MRKLGLAVLVTVASACGAQERNTSDFERIRMEINEYQPLLSTPDLAVKSWWYLKDKQNELRAASCPELVKSFDEINVKYDLVATSDMHSHSRCAPPTAFERTIDSVSRQSGSRAIVMATVKNMDPPEAGAIFDSTDKQRKERGKKYRYTLTRTSAAEAWKIETVQTYEIYNDGWVSVYKKREPSRNDFVYDGDQ